MGVAATIVDVDALLEVAAVSLVAGVGVTAVFSIAISGLVRSVDLRRDGRRVEAAVSAAVAAVALAVSVAAVAVGIVVMTHKD